MRFTLTVNDRQTLSTRGEGDLRDALREALSLGEDAQALLPIAFEDDALGLQLSGFISPPTHLKSARRWLLTYVNGRIVRCGVLSKAIESAYASLAPSGRFPYGAIFLTLPLSDVDVNVHPAKREVRYAQPNVIFSFVRHGVARALEEAGVNALLGDSPNGALTPAAGAPSQAPDSLWARGAGNAGLSPSGSDGTFRQGAFGFSHSGVSHSGSSPSALSHSGLYRPLEAAAGAEGLTSPAAARDDEAPFHVIGQLFNTYILLETPKG